VDHEDRFNGPRPAWECAGASSSRRRALRTTEATRAQRRTHRARVFRAARGSRTVRDAITDPHIQRSVRLLLDTEILPHLPSLHATDAAAYAETVLERFTNPTVAYALQKLGADGSRKLRERLGPTAAAVHAAGGVAQHTRRRRCHVDTLDCPLCRDRRCPRRPTQRAAARTCQSTNNIGELAEGVLASTPVLPASITSDTRFCDSVIRQARVGTREPVGPGGGDRRMHGRIARDLTICNGSRLGGDTANTAVYLAHYGGADRAIDVHYMTLVGDDLTPQHDHLVGVERRWH